MIEKRHNMSIVCSILGREQDSLMEELNIYYSEKFHNLTAEDKNKFLQNLNYSKSDYINELEIKVLELYHKIKQKEDELEAEMKAEDAYWNRRDSEEMANGNN